ncbi:MAG TPA: cytochrome c oxidase subunit 3 family protein [Tepidisphaeraceae bacterium]|nr:cytochrome c oxidase subunit 3 family protein [Tepidisphaeraceae bacterium]
MSASHPTILAHQFDDLHQQKESVTLGMWAFLVTEVMFFGGAFLGYAVYRFYYPEAFAYGSSLESWRIGAFNTVVLLISSLTVALAVHEAQGGNNGGVIRYLVITIALALLFVGVKGYEYNHIIEAGHAPWQRFTEGYYAGDNPSPSAHGAGPHGTGPHAQGANGQGAHKATTIFFSFYFAMTSIHALHMLIGVGLFIWLIKLARRNRFSPKYYNPVEVVGLYWHFVDIVWIFIYPLFYLIDPKW